MLFVALIEMAFVFASASQEASALTTDHLRSLAHDLGSTSGTVGNWSVSKRFDASDCNGVPSTFGANLGCGVETDGTCVGGDFTTTSSGSSSSEVASSYFEFTCVDNYSTALADTYPDTPYLLIDFYSDEKCTELLFVNAYATDGKCHNFLNGTLDEDRNPASWLITLNANDSISYSIFAGFGCEDFFSVDLYSSEKLQAGECTNGVIASAVNIASGSSAGSNNSAGVIGGFAVGSTALIIAAAILMF